MSLTRCSIEYNKKPGKPAVVKVVKDTSVPRDDLYKSGTIHTGPGEPGTSRSRQTPKGKQKPAKAITSGKLLRPGGPGGGPSKLATGRGGARPIARSLPQSVQQSQTPRPIPTPQPATVTQPKQPVIPVANGISHTRNASAGRAPPPPPPAAPPAAKKDTYKVLYDFSGQSANELSIIKDELIEVIQKEGNGTSVNDSPLLILLSSRH